MGAYPILGLRQSETMGNSTWSVVSVNRSFREDDWPHIEEWLIIAVDHGGNPMGFAPDGHIWVSDHDVGVVEPIAHDFQDFIRNYCLGP